MPANRLVANKSNSLNGKSFEVAIIGAGMSGLASGIRLGIAGKESIILERHNASGGLNSFYSINGFKYDVGLHALTNFVKKGTKGTPLIKLFRQLRIPYDAFELSPQLQSSILFPSCEILFNNEYEFFESQIAEKFPEEIDGFRKLVNQIKDYDALKLENNYTSARKIIKKYLKSTLLEDMLLCPTMYYGSSSEQDMDFGQFTILFKALFMEGFSRPFNGVRTIIKVLQDKYRDLGGIRKMKCGVSQIISEKNKATKLILDDGSHLYAKKIISTIGYVETLNLCNLDIATSYKDNTGRLSFTETITLIDKEPKKLGWDKTIIFFNLDNEFKYRSPKKSLVDPRSGVICIPNNYIYPNEKTLDYGIIRITALANLKRWFNLNKEQYYKEKETWYKQLKKISHTILPATNEEFNILAKDMFTPKTIHKFTGHLNGTIYGATNKIKDGRTPLKNLYIAGTDQGFLGIVGAMLSGISITNSYCIKD